MSKQSETDRYFENCPQCGELSNLITSTTYKCAHDECGHEFEGTYHGEQARPYSEMPRQKVNWTLSNVQNAMDSVSKAHQHSKPLYSGDESLNPVPDFYGVYVRLERLEAILQHELDARDADSSGGEA